MALLAQAEDMTLADFSFAAKFHAADSHARFRLQAGPVTRRLS